MGPTADSRFTFAELVFLAAGRPGWAEVAELLSIPSQGEDVAAAGASSLLVRELARYEGGKIQTRNDVSKRIELMLRPSKAIALAKGDESGMAASLVFVPNEGGQTAMMSIIAPGVWDINPLVDADDPITQLRDFVLALAGSDNMAIALGRGGRPSEAMIGQQDGAWRFGPFTDDQSDIAPLPDRDAVSAKLDELLRAWLA